MNENTVNEIAYIECSRRLKKLNLNLVTDDFSATVHDFKFLEYNRSLKKRKLLDRDHAHSFFELQILVRGWNEYHADGQTMRVEAGSFVLFCPGMIHRMTSSSDEFSKLSLCFGIEFPDGKKNSLLGAAVPEIRLAFDACDDSFLLPIRYIFEAVDTESETGLTIIKWQLMTAITALVTFCARNHKKAMSAKADEHISRDEEFQREAIRYMKEHLADKTIVSTLSKCLFMSERQFRRRLLLCSGKGPRELLDSLRYERIRELLLLGTPIRDICEQVGFSEESSLNRFFKRMEGMTPAQYRDQLTILNYQ